MPSLQGEPIDFDGGKLVAYTDTKSAQLCGCDEGAKHFCKDYPLCDAGLRKAGKRMGAFMAADAPYVAIGGSQVFGTDAKTRKSFPVFTGFMMYFPDAIAAVAYVSKLGNDQHNPGQPLHWAREKSTDQMDTAARHQMDHGTGHTKDSDGAYHLAKAAWRILAELQLTIEREREGK